MVNPADKVAIPKKIWTTSGMTEYLGGVKATCVAIFVSNRVVKRVYLSRHH